MEEEIFKPINGYEGLYEISSWGRVKSLAKRWLVGVKKESFLKGHNTSGYINVTLSDNRVKKLVGVHRLVATHFCDNPSNYTGVNHKNSIRNDNYYKNLEWVTISQNAVHGYKFGFRKAKKGCENGLAKLKEQQVVEIIVLCKKGDLSQKKIAKLYGIGQAQVSRINTNKRWSHIL